MILLILFVLVALGVVWVQWVEPNWFHLRHRTVRVAKSMGRPLTILHLSDFHFTRPRFFMERFVDRLSRLAVDLVFVTGDLIDGPGGIRPCVALLKKLKPKNGIYAVLGNHDYHFYPLSRRFTRITTGKYDGVERPETEILKRALREGGIHLLANQHTRVALEGGGEVNIIGIDDPITRRANMNQAFRGLENGVLGFALVHSPTHFPALKKRGVDVAFAGHTHGGQIRLPGIGALPWIRRLERIVDPTDRYGFFGLVSRGMGATPSFRLRFFCRPEALLVRIEGS
jgi:predicted MPP superfamily phosphohydrolase